MKGKATINRTTFSSIILNTVTAQIDFQPSENGKCSVVCYEPENARYDVSVTDGVLMISWVDQRNWLDRLTVLNFHTPTITVYLPEGAYQSLKVNNTTGDIKINGEWNFIDVSLSTTTGDIHAGGLRYHGAGTIVSQLIKDGYVEAVDLEQKECFEAGCLFAKSEGIIPAPESCHAIAATVREALECKKTGESKTILFCLSGHGLIDMSAYDQYLAGNIH